MILIELVSGAAPGPDGEPPDNAESATHSGQDHLRLRRAIWVRDSDRRDGHHRRGHKDQHEPPTAASVDVPLRAVVDSVQPPDQWHLGEPCVHPAGKSPNAGVELIQPGDDRHTASVGRTKVTTGRFALIVAEQTDRVMADISA